MENENTVLPWDPPGQYPPLAPAAPSLDVSEAANGLLVDDTSDESLEDDNSDDDWSSGSSDESLEDDNSDDDWSSGSSFTGSSDDESILTYDTEEADSINFVRPRNNRNEWGFSMDSFDDDPYRLPEEEGSWRMDPEDSYSDYTIYVTSKETGEERTYYVHKFILAHGPCGCEYFASLFRTPCRENKDGFSRFVFSSDVANFFPDFLDIIYQPSFLKNVDLYYHKFEETLYGGNLLQLRSLALYFGCRKLLSTVKSRIKSGINDVHHIVHKNSNNFALQKIEKYVIALCEDETAEDAGELLSHLVGTLVRCFDLFASSDERNEIMRSIIQAMTPDVLMSLIQQATSTLTSRYRIAQSKSSEPFSALVLEYLNEIPHINIWHFERIVLYLLDLLPQKWGAVEKLARDLSVCAEKRGMFTEFLQRAVKGYWYRPLETVVQLKLLKEILDKRAEINRFRGDDEVNPTRVVIEGKFCGNQDMSSLRYRDADLGGKQGDPDELWVKTFPEMNSRNVKAMIYAKIGLRTEQQRIEYKDEDNKFVLFEEDDTLQNIESKWTDDTLYLKSVAYCPR